MKYGLHDIIVTANEKHLSSVNALEVAKIASSTAPSAKKYSLARSNTTVISESSGPVNLSYTLIGLLIACMTHEQPVISTTLCGTCTSTILSILDVFSCDTLFVSRILLLIGKFSLDDDCIEIMLHRRIVAVVVNVCKQHMANSSLVKVTVELFSNLACLEVKMVASID